MRAAVALGLLAWLAHRVGLAAILKELATAQFDLVLLATVMLAADSFLKAWNWQQLLAANVDDQRVPMLRVITWFFAGGFIGAIVPSSAGTDACRVVLAAKGLKGHAPACTASIVTLNALGWFTGCIIGLIGLGILASEGRLPVLLKPVASVFLTALVALPIAYGALASKRARVVVLIARVGTRWPRAGQALTKFVEALLVFEHAHMRFPVFVLVAACGLMAQTGMFALTAHAVRIDLPFAVWMVLVPLTRIVALVPVSIADFGLIQAAHVSVLTLFGVPPWQSFALSTLFAVEGLLIHSTLGASAFLFGGGRAEPPAEPEQAPAPERNSASTG